MYCPIVTYDNAIEPRQLAIWDREMNEVNLPGPVMLSAGNSSANLKTAQVEIV